MQQKSHCVICINKNMNSAMEKKLYQASLTGNVQALDAVIQEDQLILDRISLTPFNETPLHIAALRGHLGFARLLLNHKPNLSATLDSLRRSPLHLASAGGQVEIVQELLRVEGGSNLCSCRDQDGRTPLHLAAMNEHLEVIKVLTRARPEIAQVGIDHEETILHMCVMHNRFEALKLLMELWRDEDVAKMVDRDGNTLLHLATIHKQIETLKYLLNKSSIKANGNAVNVHGFTALDVLDHCPRDYRALETREILVEAGIKRAKDLNPLPKTLPLKTTTPIQNLSGNATSEPKPKGCISSAWNAFFNNESTNWLERERGNLVIAATIIVAMTFYAGIHPPRGTYFDSNNGQTPRNADQIMIYMANYHQFLTMNTIPLIVSLFNILILVSGINLRNGLIMWLLMQGMLTTSAFIIITYLYSIADVSSINSGSLFLCLVWILMCAISAFVSTVYFIVCGVKKLWRKIGKGKTGRAGGKSENPVDV